jgi:non-heme chloroperoxidase
MRNFIIILLFLSVCADASAKNDYIKISDDTAIYYEELGSGQTIIFIPGWTFPHNVFDKQINYFSKKYHVIAIDPRGQGLSTTTLENNNYDQHGNDLSTLINKLQLKNVILVGWSLGCYDAYAYIKSNGTSNLKAFVCIDSSPKANGDDREWKIRSSHNNGADVMREMEHNRYEFTRRFAQGMVDHKLAEQDLEWIVDQSLRTPTFVALLLLFDALNSNYQPEAILLDKKGIPTLNIISKPMGNNAISWLRLNVPHSKNIIFGDHHMMFWEYPHEFNNILDEFIISLDKPKIKAVR